MAPPSMAQRLHCAGGMTWHCDAMAMAMILGLSACSTDVDFEADDASAADRPGATTGGNGEGASSTTGGATPSSAGSGGDPVASSGAGGVPSSHGELIDLVCAGCGADEIGCVHSLREEVVMAHDGCEEEALAVLQCYAAVAPAADCEPLYPDVPIPAACEAARLALDECSWDGGCYGVGCSYDGGECPSECSTGICADSPPGLVASCSGNTCTCIDAGQLVGTCEDFDGCDPYGAEWSTLSGCCFELFYP